MNALLSWVQPNPMNPIVRFLDRVSDFAGREPLMFPRALAYTLAHEVGHVLMGIDTRSLTGVMKAQWSEEDRYAKWSNRLTFTPEDTAMIASRRAQFGGMKVG